MSIQNVHRALVRLATVGALTELRAREIESQFRLCAYAWYMDHREDVNTILDIQAKILNDTEAALNKRERDEIATLESS